MKCLNINFINKIIYEDAERLVRESEINYQNQILNLCSNVTKKKDTHPVLLISGPSGSGKLLPPMKYRIYYSGNSIAKAALYLLIIIFVQIIRPICLKINMAT